MLFMKTIVASSQKGGSGKTTLCAHLAVEAERQGDGPVWLIDTDKQGTLSQWHERRAAEQAPRFESPAERHGEILLGPPGVDVHEFRPREPLLYGEYAIIGTDLQRVATFRVMPAAVP